MLEIFKVIQRVALAAILVLASLVPVEAMPVQPLQKMTVSGDTDIVLVQSGRRSSGRNSNDRYWNGYRGSRNQCRNCRRRNDGWWYPAAAFTAGAVIGSAAARPRTVHHVHHVSSPSNNSRHIAWCQNRFRTYRISDNTFQPNSGPRRQCVSPYW